MAPEHAFGPGPPDHAGGRDRPEQAAGKLLPAGEQRGRAHHRRHGLNEAKMRVAFHVDRQARHGLAAHHAVGIQHDHMVICAAETGHPLLDIARLATDIAGAAAIMDRAREGLAHFQIGLALGFAIFRVGIRQDEEFEALAPHHLRQRSFHDRQAAEHAQEILVADRQQDGGARLERCAVSRDVGAHALALADRQQQEADRGSGKAEGDPGEKRDEQGKIDALPEGNTVQADRPAHLVRGKRGGQQCQQHNQQPAGPQVDVQGAMDPTRRGREILHRHGKRRLCRHAFERPDKRLRPRGPIGHVRASCRCHVRPIPG